MCVVAFHSNEPQRGAPLAFLLVLVCLLAATVANAQVPPAKPDTTVKPMPPDTTEHDPRVRIDTTTVPTKPVRPKTIIIVGDDQGNNAPTDTIMRKEFPGTGEPPYPSAPLQQPPAPRKK